MSGYGNPVTPQSTATPGAAQKRIDLLGYTAGGLGVLTFVWGFLDWFSQGSGGNDSAAGYSIVGGGAGAVVGLSLVAGLLAAARAFEHRPASLEPVVVSIAALLVVFGVFIGKSNVGGGGDVGADIGLILALVTAILQVAVLGYAWLTATGRVPSPGPAASAQPSGQWQQPPVQYQAGGQPYQPTQTFQGPASQPGYQPPAQPTGQPGYQSPPPSGYQPPQAPAYRPPESPTPGHRAPETPGYQPPQAPGYRPAESPGYQPPPQQNPPQGPPQGPQQNPPQGPQH